LERPITEYSEVTDTSPKTFVILGSKRGGTSFLAQCLGTNGVHIESCGNGHNEDLAFVDFNDKILKEAGGDWNNLPDDDKIAEAIDNHKAELLELLKKGRKMWGWKDPRQGATIKHFLPYSKDDVYLVCIFRKPKKVAESMQRVWGRSLEKGERIAKDYYKRIVAAIKEFAEL